MFDLLGNIKEFKNISISKVLIGGTIVGFLLRATEKISPEIYANFLITLSYFSEKLDFEKWKSVLSIIQILTAAFLVLLFLVYIVILVYITPKYWMKLGEQAPKLTARRMELVQVKLPTYLLFVSLLYGNIVLFYGALKIDLHDYVVPLAIYFMVMFIALASYITIFIYQQSDE
ncbi:hypothetical protein ABDI30_23555 [Paenibacillus cisolokensis]|uniref:hypothetical protein n=1 Tax=Paenibacillus cisolokensis TaxID=1658519 RepID=UPI003D2C0426